MLRKDVGGDLEVAIDPEELDGLDEASVRALYEQRLAEMRAASQTEVCSPSRKKLIANPLRMSCLLCSLQPFFFRMDPDEVNFDGQVE